MVDAYGSATVARMCCILNRSTPRQCRSRGLSRNVRGCSARAVGAFLLAQALRRGCCQPGLGPEATPVQRGPYPLCLITEDQETASLPLVRALPPVAVARRPQRRVIPARAGSME